MSEIKVVILIFALILSPCVLGLLPDRPVRKKRHQPEPVRKADPLPERSFCDVQETKTDSEVSFCDVLEPESETVADDVIDFHDYFDYEYTPTEKERKAEFDKMQAYYDAKFLAEQIMEDRKERKNILEDIEYINGKIFIARNMQHGEEERRYKKDLEKLESKLKKNSAKIHNTEKKLRSAQFKAGMEITC